MSERDSEDDDDDDDGDHRVMMMPRTINQYFISTSSQVESMQLQTDKQ